jgi:hypothetical protein
LLSRAVEQRTRTTLLLAGFSTIYWLVVLFLDRSATLGQQLALATTTWAFLIVALRLSPPSQRIQVLSMILVASCCECIGSLMWGVYRYRLGNIPMYVPPGHGLFFLMALRLSEVPTIERCRRVVIGAVLVGSVALLIRGVFLSTDRDLLGLATWLVLIVFLIAGRRPTFYAVSYLLTMALEFYGTGQGNWAWVPILPYVGIGIANPPFGIGGAYCTMDAVARRLAPRLEDLLAQIRRTRTDRGDGESIVILSGAKDPYLVRATDSSPAGSE